MELGALGEFVGSIGVIATLIYLAVQIRQNSMQLRLSSIQSVNEKFAALIAQATQDPVRVEVLRDGLESYSSLRPEQQALFHSFVFNSITAYRSNTELFRAGAIPAATLKMQKVDLARILGCPGSIEWSESLNFEPEVRAAWDAEIADIVDSTGNPRPLNVVLPFLCKKPS
jgi:hypothetical protein